MAWARRSDEGPCKSHFQTKRCTTCRQRFQEIHSVQQTHSRAWEIQQDKGLTRDSLRPFDRLCWARGLDVHHNVCLVPRRCPAGCLARSDHRAMLGARLASQQPGCPGFPQNPGPMCFGMRRPLRDCRRAAPISSSARFQFADLDVSEEGSPIGIGREWAFSDLAYREPFLGPQRGPHLSPSYRATGYSNSLVAESNRTKNERTPNNDPITTVKVHTSITQWR